MKGTKVIVIAAEYSATASKADEVLIVRSGTTSALVLGIAQVLISDNLYDADYVRANTDLPLLVWMDNGEMLRAGDVFKDYQLAKLENNTLVVPTDGKGPSVHQQQGPVLSEKQRAEWGDFVYWDAGENNPVAMNRDQIGSHFSGNPRLTGEFAIPPWLPAKRCNVAPCSTSSKKCSIDLGPGGFHSWFGLLDRGQSIAYPIYGRHGAQLILQ